MSGDEQMDFAKGLAVALCGVVVATMSQAAEARSGTEVGAIAEQITVPINGPDTGSGVIVGRQGDTYTVVTNCHVVKTGGNYTVQTPDRQQHFVSNSQIKCLGEVDLAILRFNSTKSYRVAELGDANQLKKGTKVYLAGWIATHDSSERSFRFPDGQISGLTTPQQGYSLIYSNLAQPGMSGGSLLDEEGRVVGINGRARPIPQTGGVEYWGIPSNTLVEEAAKENIPLQLAKHDSPAKIIELSGGMPSPDITASRPSGNSPGFTFNTPGGYSDCMQDILLLYEDKERLQQQGRQSNCLPQIFQQYADTGLSWSEARRLIEAANSYATNPPLTVKLYPAGGLRSRIKNIFNFQYEIDR